MKRVCLVAVVIALLVWWLVPAPAQTTTFYVRTDGHDTASGANNTSDPTTGAWLTIGKCASTLTAGQTCVVADGTYTEVVDERSNGTAGNPITYRAATQYGAVIAGSFYAGGYSGGGDYVTFDGFKVDMPAGANFGVWVNGEHVTIQNVWVTTAVDNTGNNNTLGPSATAIHFENLAAYSTVTRSRIEHTCFGLVINGTSNVVSYNHITDMMWNNALTLAGSCGDTDAIRFFGDGHSILYNSAYGTNYNAHPRPYDGAYPHFDCIQTFDNTYSSSNILVEGNYCRGMHQGMMLGNNIRSVSSTWTIRNNVFLDIEAWCICNIAIADMHILNNTCHVIGDQLEPITALGNGLYCRNSAASCEFKNNLVYHASATTANELRLYGAELDATYIDGDASAPGENNVLYAPSLTVTGFAEDIINQDPQFMNLAGGNVHLKATSPARNAGQTIAGWTNPTDRDGLVRPQQTNWASGAYEWTGVPAAPSNPRIQ